VDYVARLTFRSASSAQDRDAALMRRTSWNYPAGVKVVAEYWPLSADLQVVAIISAEDVGALWEIEAEWSDVFDVDIAPAVSAEEGLRIGPDVFGRLQRLQP
jgi:hypothetical protein